MMPQSQSDEAWNNFVMNSFPEDYPKGSIKNAAAIASRYMSGANGGGLNSFLTNSWELDAAEVCESLEKVGALIAANELRRVLGGLGVPVPPTSQDDRWNLLERHWTDELNDLDFLSDAADRDLMRALEIHVQENEKFYLALE
jgi:hypothetical protein